MKITSSVIPRLRFTLNYPSVSTEEEEEEEVYDLDGLLFSWCSEARPVVPGPILS